MNGTLPPNSSDIFFIVPAHCCISNLATSVKPVKVDLRTKPSRVDHTYWEGQPRQALSLASMIFHCLLQAEVARVRK
jgi:hypothetical protein